MGMLDIQSHSPSFRAALECEPVREDAGVLLDLPAVGQWDVFALGRRVSYAWVFSVRSDSRPRLFVATCSVRFNLVR